MLSSCENKTCYAEASKNDRGGNGCIEQPLFKPAASCYYTTATTEYSRKTLGAVLKSNKDNNENHYYNVGKLEYLRKEFHKCEIENVLML